MLIAKPNDNPNDNKTIWLAKELGIFCKDMDDVERYEL